MKKIVSFAVLTAMALCVDGADYVWDGSDGNWTDSARWNPQGVPGTEDNVTVSGGSIVLGEAVTVNSLTLGGTVTFSGEQLTIAGAANSSFRSTSGTDVITFNNKLNFSNANSDSLTMPGIWYFKGGLRYTSYFTTSCYVGGAAQHSEIHFQEVPVDLGRFRSNAKVYIEVSSNNLGRVELQGDAGGELHVMVDDPWTTKNCHNQEFDYFFIYNCAPKIYLNGHDIYVLRAIFDAKAGAEINTDTEATVSIRSIAADSNKRYGKNLAWTGPLSIRLTSDSLEATPFVCESVIASTGALIVEGGVFEFGSTAKWDSIAYMRLIGGKVSIPEGRTFTVPALYFDDSAESVPDGSYTAADYPERITGGGTIKVQSLVVGTDELTWTGGDGTSTDIRDAGNWKDVAEVPSLGSLVATFAESGSLATFTGAFPFRGIAFDAPGDFRISSSDALTLGNRGISAVSSSASNVYTLDAPVKLSSDQTWNVADSTTVSFASAVAEEGVQANVYKVGAGTVEFNAGNTFTGSLTISNGVVNVANVSNGLGRAGGTVRVHQQHGGALVFNGGINEKDVCFYGNVTVSTASSGVYFPESTTNAFLGAFDMSGNSNVMIESNAVVRLSGGMSGYYNCFRGKYGKLVIDTTPVNCDLLLIGPYTEIRVAGNGNSKRLALNSSSVHFHVDFAYDTSTTYLGIDSPNNYADLHGHDQRFGCLYCATYNYNYNGNAYITSGKEGPATLYFDQNKPRTTDGINDNTNKFMNFRGQLSLNKKGAYGFVQTVSCPSSGDITVTDGLFEFYGNGDWLNGTNITVSGESDTCKGVIALNKSETFGKHAVLSVSGKGRFSLAEGVVQKCEMLMIDGVRVRGGLWGSSESGATYVDDVHFSGKGMLSVRRCPLIITVR